MAFELYSYFRSSAAYRVRTALNHKGIPYTYKAVHLLNDGGEQNKDEYRQVNPMAQVPSLVHDGFLISQSMAIFDYLDLLQPEPRLFPAEAKSRAQCIQLCEIINSGIHPLQNLKVLQHIEKCFSVDQAGKNAWAAHWISQGFTGLENTLKRSSGKFAMGDSVSAADMFIVPQVYNAHRFKIDMNEFPIVAKIERNCLELEIFQKAVPEAQPDFPKS